ncbi:hypothetical protein ABS768_08835 [Flavobacterium sp. ST-75]|uniref:Uncharacterized protein n=1 Tax=Flavobacterium rhizophilum TaxID=3163296 RepID=A0ABW8YE86_9FLAO
MEKTLDNVIISEGRRPFWQTIIAALFYTVTAGLLLMAVIAFFLELSMETLKGIIGIVSLSIVTFAYALKFSAINNVYFDLENRKYKKEIVVGPFKTGKWIELPEIDYISVFRQGWSKDSDGDGRTDSSGYVYDVNVWHNTSKHFTIYSNGYPEASLEMGRQLAVKLNTDLLDATDPFNKEWVDL